MRKGPFSFMPAMQWLFSSSSLPFKHLLPGLQDLLLREEEVGARTDQGEVLLKADLGLANY